MKKILIGKIGQKLIFNRNSPEALRSGTNGNVTAYSTFKLLIENNPEFMFFVVGDNDLETLKELPENVVDAKHLSPSILKIENPDYGIFLTGMSKDESREIKLLNKLGINWTLLSDDPRCLETISNNKSLKNYPDKILTQFDRDIIFNGKEYKAKYVPLEMVIAYGTDFAPIEPKIYPMSVIANTTNKINRIGYVHRMTKGTDIPVIGRLSEVEKETYKFRNHMGEVDYETSQKLLSQSMATFIVSVDYDCVTTKYVEALLNNCLPVFHCSYGHKYLKDIPEELIISSKEEFDTLYNNILKDSKKYFRMIVGLQNKLIKPYMSGKKLNKELINAMGVR